MDTPLVSVLVLKVVLTPLFIAAATLAQRRWGSALAGLLVGLPLTSGSVSVFLALEQGRAFAAQSALGTVLGIVAMSAFCVAYSRVARRLSWAFALALAIAACVMAAAVLSLVPADFFLSVALALGCLGFLVVLMGRPVEESATGPASWWDLPARMLVATVLVVLITAEARALGPKWSGMVSSVPAYAAVLGVFSHVRVDANAAHTLLRGMSVSAFSVVSFFVVVRLFVQGWGIPGAYALAVGAALATAGVCRPLATRVKRRGAATAGAGETLGAPARDPVSTD